MATPALTQDPPLILRFPPPMVMGEDQFYAFCQANPGVKMELTSFGEVVVLPTGYSSSKVNMEVALQLALWARTDATGVALGPDAGFVLPNKAIRSPNASWLVQSRIDALDQPDLERFLPLCPDFVIEVRSATDALNDQQDKMVEYIASGARLGWLIDPLRKCVHVYRPGKPVELLREPAEVGGSPELPGFVLDLTKIWG